MACVRHLNGATLDNDGCWLLSVPQPNSWLQVCWRDRDGEIEWRVAQMCLSFLLTRTRSSTSGPCTASGTLLLQKVPLSYFASRLLLGSDGRREFVISEKVFLNRLVGIYR